MSCTDFETNLPNFTSLNAQDAQMGGESFTHNRWIMSKYTILQITVRVILDPLCWLLFWMAHIGLWLGLKALKWSAQVRPGTQFAPSSLRLIDLDKNKNSFIWMSYISIAVMTSQLNSLAAASSSVPRGRCQLWRSEAFYVGCHQVMIRTQSEAIWFPCLERSINMWVREFGHYEELNHFPTFCGILFGIARRKLVSMNNTSISRILRDCWDFVLANHWSRNDWQASRQMLVP